MKSATVENRTALFRWWFAPSWLGLDAPCVVSTWTWAASLASNTLVTISTVASLFLVVWFIYLGDRVVDVASCQDWTRATGRLRFGRHYRPLFLAGMGFCLTGLLSLFWVGIPREVLFRATLVAMGVCLHYLAFVTPLRLRVKLPGKEFGVGLFFALGAYSCLGATIRSIPLLASIALLVAFNCLIIAARDADSDRANDPGGASCWWYSINRDLLYLGLALTLTATLSSVLARETAFYLSVTAAFAALTALHATARLISGDAVRALADFSLLTPIPIMGVVKWMTVQGSLR